MLSTLVLATLCAAPAPKPSLESEVAAWHQKRLARLTAEDGWLSLVGLFWLEPGDTVAGSRADARVHLPDSAPATLGTFTRTGTAVRFTPAPGIEVTVRGTKYQGEALKNDEGDDPDVLRYGTLQLLVIERDTRVGIRVRDSEAPTRKAFRGIERFPVSASWVVTARFEPAAKGATLVSPTALGEVTSLPLAGTLTFERDGAQHRLQAALEEGSPNELFVVFGDKTNGHETYGPGRFLIAAMPGKDQTVVLDFNRAYNPPCAFTKFATCPLPAKQNRLSFRVEAGEKKAGGH